VATRKKPKPRDWTPRERRLVSEFTVKFYEGYEVRFQVSIGATPRRLMGRFMTEATERLVGKFRRWADALVLLPDRVVLIEGKIVPQPGVISQLDLYERLIPKTPELQEHSHKPVEKLLVCAIEDPVVTQMAREQNIRVVVFRPKWIDDYLEIIPPREGTPTPGELE